MRRATRIGLGLLVMAATAPGATADSSGGVAPATTSSCPSDHPIKGYASRHAHTGREEQPPATDEGRSRRRQP
jgi:hypothetical protein